MKEYAKAEELAYNLLKKCYQTSGNIFDFYKSYQSS